MVRSSLFKLDPVVDNPKFEGFGFKREKSLRGKASLIQDFMPDDRKTKGRAWTITPLAPHWVPQPVAGRVRPFNDYPCVDLLIPAFSRRAVDALRDFLEPNGELLPLVSSVGEYYAYNITTVVDILDQDKSEFEWYDDEQPHGFPDEVVRYECIPEKMEGLSIFRIVEHAATAFVTQTFVDRVEQLGLQGFHFVKLWSSAEDAGRRETNGKGSRPEPRSGTEAADRSIKANTVVIMLPTAKAKPSRAEKDRLATIMDQIDGLLYDPKAGPEESYFGSLEGNDAVAGELRLFLSTPDADALVARLNPWLRELNNTWTDGVKVLKRYGAMGDADCREVYATV